MQHLSRSHLKNDYSEKAVMPAKAGIQKNLKTLDSRLHGNDKVKQDNNKFVFEMASNEMMLILGNGERKSDPSHKKHLQRL
jgi:hypothetical protein